MKFVKGTLPGIEGVHDIAVLEGDTHICKWIEQNGRLDQDANMIPRLADLKLINQESVVYDLGAMVGDLTAWFASLRPRAVVAFEAYADACACLDHNMRPYIVSGMTSVSIIRRPIGNDESVIGCEWKDYPQMAQGDPDENKGARTMVMCNRWTPDGPVYTLRIDDRLKTDKAPPPPTFIKIDIEGWEVKALRGADRTLREHHPIILCEVYRGALERAGNSPKELHALLTSHGYEMRDLYTDEPWLPDDERTAFDVIARPR